jgi:hypothetical protein
MPFEKGSPKPAGSGRQKSQAKPKVKKSSKTSSAKDAVLYAFDELGGYKKFAQWAITNRDDFYGKMFMKLIPTDKTLSGEVGVKFVEDLND